MVPLVAADAGPALSQMGGTWPTDGRVVGIVADGAADLDGIRAARQAVLDAGMVPLVIAPAGGTLDADDEPVAVQRTFATARSVECDALLFAGAPAPGSDAHGARDAKAGTAAEQGPDPRVLLLLTEAYRHGKVVGGWNGAPALLEALGIASDGPGIIMSRDGTTAVEAVVEALAGHRAWDRFPPAP